MDRPDDAPFSGIRVLDLSDGIAGPTATMYLADFDAPFLAGTGFVRKIDAPGIGRLRVLSPFDHTD